MLHCPKVVTKSGDAFTSYSTEPTPHTRNHKAETLCLHRILQVSRISLGLGVDRRRKQHLRHLEHFLDFLGSCLNLHVPIPASLWKL